MPMESTTTHNHPLNVKLLMLGHGSVGKTSLLLLCTEQKCTEGHEPKATIGVDTWSHKLDVRGKRVNLTVWDTPGVEQYRAMTSSYYSGTQGIVLVYDITSRQSFGAIAKWFAERGTHVPDSTVKIIIGNKADKENERQVPKAEAAAYAACMGCLFAETSVKTEIGVHEAFHDVIERIVGTPELWAEQESRHVTPPLRVSSPPIADPQANESQLAEDSERVKVLGSISFCRGLTIRFGGPPRAPA